MGSSGLLLGGLVLGIVVGGALVGLVGFLGCRAVVS